MANGTTKDLKNLIIYIDNNEVPQNDMFEAPEIQLPQARVEAIGGNNAGGYEFKINNSIDGMLTIKMFKKTFYFNEMEDKYLDNRQIKVYIKDSNTSRAYEQTDTYISNVSAYTLGDSDSVDVEILLPDLQTNTKT